MEVAKSNRDRQEDKIHGLADKEPYKLDHLSPGHEDALRNHKGPILFRRIRRNLVRQPQDKGVEGKRKRGECCAVQSVGTPGLLTMKLLATYDRLIHCTNVHTCLSVKRLV